MAAIPLIPAAQYLRMSTERQEYSLENQSHSIAEYAELHGFSVIQTYSDPAVSGVLLRRRKGLQQLLQDVVRGQASYRVILVYDVSRWGRFQDTDESAHYEFLCKSAGVRVHYCAETFTNDDSLPSMIMKSFKRAMAGEYSRELGVKVLAGQRRGATLGFRQGGEPGYGLRRLLLSADGKAKQVLATGERKSIVSDRISLVHGSAQEVRCVREIYRMFIQNSMTFSEIARELNRRKTQYIKGSEWSPSAVQTILTHAKYIGSNVYGRYTQRLYTPPVRRPRSEWTVTEGAFEPLIDRITFEKAQGIIQRTTQGLPRNRSDKDLLDALRAIVAKNGKINTNLIKKAPKAPSPHTYIARFGSLTRTYELIGFTRPWCRVGCIDTTRRIRQLRNALLGKIVDLDPSGISIENRRRRYRARLRLLDGRLISVLAARPRSCYKGAIRWFLNPPASECRLTTLVARLNLQCDAFKDMFVIPSIGKSTGVYVKEIDPRLQRGIQLFELKDLRRTIQELGSQVRKLGECGR
jgi:DNA invertase Pin-like site-specific DNA recombinase